MPNLPTRIRVLPLPALFLAFLTSIHAQSTTPAASIASLYSLSSSTSLPFPTQLLANASAVSYIVSSWSLSQGKIENGQNDLAFIPNPFPDSLAAIAELPSTSSATSASHPTSSSHQSTTTSHPSPSSATPSALSHPAVLQVTYPAGSYSHATGGAEFYSMPLNSSSSSAPFQTMLLSYDVAFSSNFNWVQGGKLPGLRGGMDAIGCSGGDEPSGSGCFSMRLMWRPLGAGEVYAYIPTPGGFCSDTGIICNSDYGISIDRGSFTFASGAWNRVSLLTRLNDPPTASNGVVQLYFNDILALQQSNLQIRNSSSQASIGGLFFSTFFGGSDITWETPTTQYTYYRDFQLWSGTAASNGTTSAGGGQSGGDGQRARMGRWEGLVGGLVGVLMALVI